MKAATCLLIVCGSLVAAGCGQKGPLYLPDKNASVVTRPGGANAASPPAQTTPDNTTPSTPAPGEAAPQQTPQGATPKDKNDDDSQSGNQKPRN
jgi:predicted small lipoprotein YifL